MKMLSKLDDIIVVNNRLRCQVVSSLSFLNHVSSYDYCPTLLGMDTFGDRLRAWREDKGVSGWQIEKQTGFSRQNLSHIEKNRRPASDEALHKLASIPEMEITFQTLKAWQMLYSMPDDVKLIVHAELEKRLGLSGKKPSK